MQRIVKSTRRGGFTLMELLVVLAILVLLMAMVAPRVLKFLSKSDVQVTTSQIGNLKQSLEYYAADCRKYPTTEQGLQALISPPAAGETGAAVRGWDGPYLDGDTVPTDAWGLPFGYAYPPTRGRGPGPDVWSYGEDNMDQTEDDLCSWTQGASGTGEGGLPGEEGMLGQGDELGGQLGPEGLPGTDPMGGGMPPLDQGGLPPINGGGMQPGGSGLPPIGGGNAPPMGGGNVPPMGGGTGPLGGGTGPLPPAGGTTPQPPRGNL